MPKELEIKHWVVGPLETNCYLLGCTETLEAVLIDPGYDGDFLSEEILRSGFSLKAVWLTHGHFDHVMGTLPIKLNFGVPLFMHSGDTELLARAQSSLKHWTGLEGDPVPAADTKLSDNDHLSVGRHHFTVLSTPGHTPGSVCFATEDLLLTGDTLFAEGVGRTDFSYSDPEDLSASLKKIGSYHQQNPTAVLLAGHGPASSLGEALSNIP